MVSMQKMLLGVSLSSLLVSGCLSISGPYSSVRPTQENTLSAQTIPLNDVSDYYLGLRSYYKNGPEQYRADLLFAKNYALDRNKKFFEFDGTTYPVNDTAVEQMEALIQARKKREKTYTFNNRKYDACSYYPADEQMAIFGNLWEELISPQDFMTKNYLSSYVNTSRSYAGSRLTMLNRLYEICRLSGYPEIRDQRMEISLMGKVIQACSGKRITYYSPSALGRGVIYLAPEKIDTKRETINYEDIPIELAHAFRSKNNLFGEPIQFITDGLKDLATFNSFGFTKGAQSKNYKNPHRMEYDAHKIVEPALNAYIKNPLISLETMYHTIQENREKTKNTYTLMPAAYKMLSTPADKTNEVQILLFGYKRRIDINRP